MAQLNMRGKLKKAPAASMVKYINQPGIPDEVAHSYQTYLDMIKAHVVMCARAGIIDRDAAVRILKTTKEMAAMGDKPTFPIDPASEGLYFNLEKYLIEHTSMDAGDKVTLLVRATTSAARTVLHSCIKSFSTGQKTLGESAEGGEGRAPQNSHI